MNIFKLLQLFLFHFLHECHRVQSSEFLSLLRTENSDHCVTNSSIAMYYTKKDGTIHEETFLFPYSKNSYNERKNMKNVFEENEYWYSVKSLESDGLPVFDQRWTVLQTRRITHIHPTLNNALLIEPILKFTRNPNNFRIPLSVRATNIEIFFCNGDNISRSNCYWFVLKSDKITLSKCEKELSIIKGQPPACKNIVHDEELTNPYQRLSFDKWSHILLEKQGTRFLLKHMNSGQEKTYFDYKDDPTCYPIRCILLHTKDKEAFYKIHDYEYLRTKRHKPYLKTLPIQVEEKKICFSMFLTTCEQCNTLIYLKGGNTLLGEKEKLGPSYGNWTQYKISRYIEEENIERVHVEIHGDDEKSWSFERFWAVDAFRKCEEEEYQISEARGPLKYCQLVIKDQKVEWNRKCTKQSMCQRSNALGESCVACNNQTRFGFPDVCSRKVCERIDNNEKCYCRTDKVSIRASIPFDNMTVEWNENSTIRLSWNYRDFAKCNSIDFEIKVMYPQQGKILPPYPLKGLKCLHHYNCQVNISFPPSTDILIELYSPTISQKQSIKMSEYSYPAVPALVNSDISITHKTNSTRFTLNIAEKDETLKNTCQYLIILSRETNTSFNDKNLRKMENLVSINLESYTRIVAEIDLTQYKSKILEYTIGDNSSTRSELLNETIVNRPLEINQLSEIVALMINRYKRKYRYAFYSTNITRVAAKDASVNQENEEKSSGTSLYYLLYIFFLLAFFVIVAVTITSICRRRANDDNSKSLDMILNDIYEISPIEEEVRVNYRKSPAALICTNKKLELELSKATDYPKPSDKIHSKVIKLSDFEDYVKRSLEYKELERQHELFPRGQTQPWKYGSLDENKHKNRFLNLITYDHSRVKLKEIPGEKFSDYINASYIDGYAAPKSYIATQGPKRETLRDFWRMIWQEKVKYIVMVANINEEGKEHVYQYWPTNGESSFQGINVQIEAVKVFSDFEHRKFRVARGHETRNLEQIHFTGWPEQSIPLYAYTLRPFIQKILEIPLTPLSPIVIHCSAGVGRTGTILLVDICLRMAAKEKQVDFVNVLQNLRQQRPNMVDNEEQYKLAHLVVLDYLMGLRTSIPCDKLEEVMEECLNCDDHFRTQIDYLKDSEWQDEAMKNVGEEAKNHMMQLKKTKRRGNHLTDNDSSTQMQTVFVDGVKCRGQFIVTQQPSSRTVGDFWRLVLEMGSEIIILPNEINLEDETCCKFWPTSEEPEFHPVNFITVKFENLMTFKSYNIFFLNMDVRQGKNMKVRIIIFNGWQMRSNMPLSCEEFLNFWEEADFLSKQSRNVIITCFDGVTVSGVYVALSHVIEKMRLEKECDVCSAVRNIRQNEKQFVKNVSQLLFLYQAALIYNTRHFSSNIYCEIDIP